MRLAAPILVLFLLLGIRIGIRIGMGIGNSLVPVVVATAQESANAPSAAKTTLPGKSKKPEKGEKRSPEPAQVHLRAAEAHGRTADLDDRSPQVTSELAPAVRARRLPIPQHPDTLRPPPYAEVRAGLLSTPPPAA